MKLNTNIPAFVSVVTTLFIALFSYTVHSKITNFDTFVATFKKSALLHPFHEWLPQTITAIELATVILLLFKRTRYIGLYASFSLMLIFTAYVAFVLISQDKLPCTCGGIINTLSWSQHLVLNALLTILALTATLAEIKRIKNANWITSS